MDLTERLATQQPSNFHMCFECLDNFRSCQLPISIQINQFKNLPQIPRLVRIGRGFLLCRWWLWLCGS